MAAINGSNGQPSDGAFFADSAVVQGGEIATPAGTRVNAQIVDRTANPTVAESKQNKPLLPAPGTFTRGIAGFEPRSAAVRDTSANAPLPGNDPLSNTFRAPSLQLRHTASGAPSTRAPQSSPALSSGTLSPASGAPRTQRPSHARPNDAVAREVRQIISAVNTEIEQELSRIRNLNDGYVANDLYLWVALDCLNGGYKRAPKKIKPQLFVNVQEILTTIVHTAISSAKKNAPSHQAAYAFTILDAIMFKIEPTVNDALLKRVFEGKELINEVLRNSLPPDGQKALGDFITNIKGLPDETRFVLLHQIILPAVVLKINPAL
jgi:hypothetical protein